MSSTRATTKLRKWHLSQDHLNSDTRCVQPLGYVHGSFHSDIDDKKQGVVEKKELIAKSAMATATAPGKSIFMTMFMLWMIGNSLQIFSIMMILMSLWTPVKAIAGVGNVFKRYEDKDVPLLMYKLIFIGINMVSLSLVLYKFHSMGLLPTSAADWISAPILPAAESSVGTFSF